MESFGFRVRVPGGPQTNRSPDCDHTAEDHSDDLRTENPAYPDLPKLNWCQLDDGTLSGGLRECHVADGTLARWVERLGLVDGRREWHRPGYSRYVGTVDGIEIVLDGITDRAAWNAAAPSAQVPRVRRNGTRS